MKLRQLQFFTAVAEELSFSRAAIKLHVAQPSLSTQIKALEDEVGARLFERDKRHVSLTPAGRRFQGRVATLLSLADSAKSEARSTELGQLGTIDLGYTAMSMFSTALPHAIRRFRLQEPNVVITLRELTSLEQLHELGERTLDVGVLRKVELSAPKGIRIVEWYRTPLAAIPQDHPRAASGALSLADLKNEAFIMYPRRAGTGIYWQVMDLCTTAGFRPRVVREVLESSTIIGLVAAGVGIAIVPADMNCIQFSGVVYRRITDAGAFTALHLAQREGDRNEHLRSLYRVLKLYARRRLEQQSRK